MVYLIKNNLDLKSDNFQVRDIFCKVYNDLGIVIIICGSRVHTKKSCTKKSLL